MAHLVIVESPTKARTINKYLGKEYVVKSSYGHVRDLPVSGRRKKDKKETKKKSAVGSMGVNPDKNWIAHYEPLPGKAKVIKELKAAAKAAESVYLAADPDREGEAIAWHLTQLLGPKNGPYHRVSYQEITKGAIKEAFSNPGEINMDRVNAQQARRFLDRVVGFQLSPLLWRQVSQGLSAGRVQSVAVRLIVEREKDIKAFVPEEYWDILANLKDMDGHDLEAMAMRYKGEKLQLSSEAAAREVEQALQDAAYQVAKREDKDSSSKPWAPFVTSTLQQAASVTMGFGLKKTMLLAQRLYESGYITYMRTDSTRLSDVAVEAIRDHVKLNYGQKYLPEKPRVYASKAGAQEAHEAIRPSDIHVLVDKVKLGKDEKRLYELIWRRTVASQMNEALFHTTTVTIGAGDYELVARGRVMRFDGWQKVLPVKTKAGDLAELPDLKEGAALTLVSLKPNQHFTKPPARYTEASLVKELEKRGIGRPSTYAAIISTIQDRNYARVEQKRFYAEKIGEVVTDQLTEGFPDLMDYQFTALMEEELDKIASSEMEWKDVLNNFYKKFKDRLHKAEQEKIVKNKPIPVDMKCPACNRPLMYHITKSGSFLGCSGYQLTGEDRCKQTLSLIRADEMINLDEYDEEQGNELELLEKKRCETCGMAMDAWLLDEKTRLNICGNAPKCEGQVMETGNFQLKSLAGVGTHVECDKCGAPMQLKEGRFGRYLACTKAPECKNTRKILKSGEVAPPKADPVALEDMPCERCESPMLIRDGAAGLFLACSAFPKCRSTGSVPVQLLADHESRLDPKYSHLAKGPRVCPECGSKVILRWSRKLKSNYFSCEHGLGKKKCKWTETFKT